MKPHNLAFISAIALLLPAWSFAQSSVDTNGDGVLTLEEVQIVMPEIDTDSFAAMDANGDGTLDADEISVAQGAGLLPPSNG
ncbi:EF-hand domain-containing protein [Ruegeria arenilitoris]|uniref:EF-hand domain-containing protein n=1 Tax=Ruegeria arenilitoris TaxID=1173585 RepID=UPI0014811CF7|nr:EF-hand domain-containing protein [Ruegeria arenilitoris]